MSLTGVGSPYVSEARFGKSSASPAAAPAHESALLPKLSPLGSDLVEFNSPMFSLKALSEEPYASSSELLQFDDPSDGEDNAQTGGSSGQ